MSESKPERKRISEAFSNLIKVLKYVAEEGRYSVLDRLARSISEDMALQAVYEALRIVKVRGALDVPEAELAKEVDEFQHILERDITIARRLATIAIAHISGKGATSTTTPTASIEAPVGGTAPPSS